MLIKRINYIRKIYSALEHVPIVVLIGARQVGKTSLLHSLDLKQAILELNGQDPEVIEIFQKYSTINEYLRIHLNEQRKGFLLIDEFQFIPNISTLLKLLVDQHPTLKIITTGSSSLDILQNVDESLAGRVRIIEVLSLSFSEFLLFSNDELHADFEKYTIQTDPVIVKREIPLLFQKYIETGGLPRVVLAANQNEKHELLNDIYQTYLLRDVRAFVRNEDFLGFNKLLKLLAAQIGNMVNINELSNVSGLSYKKTEEYLNLLEQMYIVNLIEPFYTNKRKVITKMKKVFFLDIGLRNLINKSIHVSGLSNEIGMIYENVVYLELKKAIGNLGTIEYYRTLDGAEIDFVLQFNSMKYLIEVKAKSLKKPLFMKNIESFLTFNDVEKVFVINKDYSYSREKITYFPAFFTSRLKFEENPNRPL